MRNHKNDPYFSWNRNKIIKHPEVPQFSNIEIHISIPKELSFMIFIQVSEKEGSSSRRGVLVLPITAGSGF
jgi:hypothetical protein